MRTDAPSIASVDNALQVLLLLADRQALRVVDVADCLGVARSTAHRVLASLLQRGFVVQDAGKVYRPGAAFDRLAHPARIGLPELRAALHFHLEQLGRRVGETCHLAVLEGNGTRFVDCAESPRALRVGSRIGMLLPAHSTSIGKVLLAELSPAAFLALYPRGLPGDHGTEVARRAALQRQLSHIRKRGYAVNSGESEKGIVAVGACVRDTSERALGGIAIAAPAPRCPRTRVPELVEALLTTVAHAQRDI